MRLRDLKSSPLCMSLLLILCLLLLPSWASAASRSASVPADHHSVASPAMVLAVSMPRLPLLYNPADRVVVLDAATSLDGVFEVQISQPSGPVTFCAVRNSPIANAYTASVDAGAAQSITFGGDPRCPTTHPSSFTLAGAQFVLRTPPYVIVVNGTNQFGSTAWPPFSLQIGAAPGTGAIGAVLPPGE